MKASRWRMAGAWTLVVLGIIIAVLAVIAGYVRYQAFDTPTVEETATQLIENDEVRNQIAARLVDGLFANVDVEARLEERLPPQQQQLAPLLAGGLRQIADRGAVRLLERPRIQDLWIRSIVTAQEQLVAVLDDDTTTLTTEDGYVVLNLEPLVVQLGEEVAILSTAGARLPEGAGHIRIMKADQLESAQELTQLLKSVAAVLWIVPFLLWAIAIWLARGRRRAILRVIGIGLIAVGLIVLVVRKAAGTYIVDQLVPSDSVRPAVQEAWDIVTALLADGGWTVIGLGVIAVFAVWLSGPSTSGMATRRRLAPLVVRPELAYGGAALFFLLIVLWGPTAQTQRPQFVVAGALLLALGVEILRRQTAREFPAVAEAELGASARPEAPKEIDKPPPPSA